MFECVDGWSPGRWMTSTTDVRAMWTSVWKCELRLSWAVKQQLPYFKRMAFTNARGPSVLYRPPECWGYAELEQTWKYMSTQFFISRHPYRSIRKQIWPCHKNGHGQPRASFEKKKNNRAWAYNHLVQNLAAFYIFCDSHHFVPVPERFLLPHYFT